MAYSQDVKSIIYRALCDAIDWQVSLIDAHGGPSDDPQVIEMIVVLGDYRLMLVRRYGQNRTPMERMGDGAKSVNIRDIMKCSE